LTVAVLSIDFTGRLLLVFNAGEKMEIVSHPVAFRSDDATIDCYLSFPLARDPCPAILVLSERYGLVEYVKDVSRRLAREGYVALAPEMRSRREFEELIKGSYSMIAVKDSYCGIRYLQSLDFVSKENIGVIGFCWGGYIAGLLACLEPGLKGAVIYYGETHKERTVKNPLCVPEIADSLYCPLLGLYAEIDDHPKLEDVRKFEQALKLHGKDYEFKIYAGAKHGFHNDTMPERYGREAAEDAWDKTLNFFARHLGRSV
jgi:carboxymethylenebutenolidase